MLEKLPELINDDPVLVRRGRYIDDTMMVEVGEDQYLVTIREGRIEKVEKGPHTMRSWTFTIRASSDAWAKFWQKTPEPGHHDIFALLRRADIRFEGNLQPFMANLLYYKFLLAAPRRLSS